MNARGGIFAGASVFLGCRDRAHIPLTCLKPSAELLRRLGGAVTLRIYPGMPHTITTDEIEFVREMMRTFMAGQQKSKS